MSKSWLPGLADNHKMLAPNQLSLFSLVTSYLFFAEPENKSLPDSSDLVNPCCHSLCHHYPQSGDGWVPVCTFLILWHRFLPQQWPAIAVRFWRFCSGVSELAATADTESTALSTGTHGELVPELKPKPLLCPSKRPHQVWASLSSQRPDDWNRTWRRHDHGWILHHRPGVPWTRAFPWWQRVQLWELIWRQRWARGSPWERQLPPPPPVQSWRAPQPVS